MTPQQLAFDHWLTHAVALRRFQKLKGYGVGETAETLWAKLPKTSRSHWEWLARAATLTLVETAEVERDERQHQAGLQQFYDRRDAP